MSCKALHPASLMLSFSASLAGAALFSPSALAAVAGETVTAPNTVVTHFYDLKSGLLVTTLDQISQTCGCTIAFDREKMKGVTAPPVQGNLSAGAAVAQAVAGGFTINEDGSGLIAVMPATRVMVTAKRDEAETSFKADRSDTSTRGGARLHDTPGSVTLITGKVMETQQVTTLQDALRNVSGVGFSQTPQRAPGFNVRGFSASSTSNGISDSHAASTNIFGVERVEVLKGPQAILSGSNSLGGAVNVVLKKPQADDIRDLTVQYGSHDDRTIGADVSGAFNEDRQFTYRLIGSLAQAASSDAGYDGRRNNSIMPSMRWKDASTDLIIGASYTKQRTAPIKYTFALRDGTILPAPEMLLANESDGFGGVDRRLYYQFEQVLTDDLKLTSRVQRSENHLDIAMYAGGLTYAAGASRNQPNSSARFSVSRLRANDRTLSGDHFLNSTFNTGPIRHKLSTGFNHIDYNMVQIEDSGPSQLATLFPLVKRIFPPIRDIAATPNSVTENGYRQRAIYVQDMVYYDDWTLLMNIRRNQYTRPPGSTRLIASNRTLSDPMLRIYSNTPGGGIVYRINDDTSIYASYSEGFVPQTALRCGGGIVPPIQSQNKEAGVKFDLADSKLAITASAFSLQQSNALLYNRTESCYTVRDAQQTRGAEIDMQGQVAPGLDLILNYTYNIIRNVSDSSTTFPGYSKHKASIWGVYRLPGFDLKGWSIGLGLVTSSRSLGERDPAYPVYLPGQAQLDASLSYSAGPWSAIFGVKNATNRLLYGTSSTASFIPILPGREMMLTVKRSFK